MTTEERAALLALLNSLPELSDSSTDAGLIRQIGCPVYTH